MSKNQKVDAEKKPEAAPEKEKVVKKTRNGKTRKDFENVADYFDYRAEEAKKKAAEYQTAVDRYRDKAEDARKFTDAQRKDAKRLAKLQAEMAKLREAVPTELQ